MRSETSRTRAKASGRIESRVVPFLSRRFLRTPVCFLSSARDIDLYLSSRALMSIMRRRMRRKVFFWASPKIFCRTLVRAVRSASLSLLFFAFFGLTLSVVAAADLLLINKPPQFSDNYIMDSPPHPDKNARIRLLLAVNETVTIRHTPGRTRDGSVFRSNTRIIPVRRCRG